MINVDTDKIIPKQLSEDRSSAPASASACSTSCATARTAARIRTSSSTSRPTARRRSWSRGENFGCGSLARARALGAAGFRHPLRHRAELRRHLLQQLLQERHAADHAAAGDRATQLMDDAEKGANARASPIDLETQTITRPDGATVAFRHRSVPQALPAERARRYRPDLAEGRRRSPPSRQKRRLSAALALA